MARPGLTWSDLGRDNTALSQWLLGLLTHR